MKSFIVAALSIACVLALGNAAPAPSSSDSVTQQSSQAADQKVDPRGEELVQGVKTQVDGALSQVQSGQGGLSDIESLFNSGSLAAREVLGWALGTAMGVGKGVGQAAGGALSGAQKGIQNGMEDGHIVKGLVNGVTGAASEGADGLIKGGNSGFVEGLGALLNPSD